MFLVLIFRCPRSQNFSEIMFFGWNSVRLKGSSIQSRFSEKFRERGHLKMRTKNISESPSFLRTLFVAHVLCRARDSPASGKPDPYCRPTLAKPLSNVQRLKTRRRVNLVGVNLVLAKYPQNTCKLQIGPVDGVLSVFCRCFEGILQAF